jgi:acetyl/propionyl-CoA carboxylase alpha subunit
VNKLLVANRGEIARRIFRTARSMGIATVAVFSDPDADAPHARDADEAVALPGSTPASTYLRIDRLLDAARRTGADAVHPGYGFLSENADFARACVDTGLTFVGPSPEAIEAMGSKIAAKALMAAAGVPVLPGGTISDGYRVPDGGYPVLVKAAFGGGGRGMRIVRSEPELAEAVASAEREAATAFGDGTVFVERYVEDPRHIEVQIFGDAHGEVVHLFERECSIQRRYQKIIEEAPSPAVDPTLRAALCDAAVAAGRALDYVGAGTVEFVVDRDGNFFFLEVNTRLQVEHPVTELVTGLDLVELQLRVARGERLELSPELHGHAIEARLYAEDVGAGFLPVSGRIDRLEVPARLGVRVDSGYESGSTVSTFYDAMLAKVIAHGDDRDQAGERLADALAAARVHGLPTNRDLLVGILRHPEFRAGRTDTGFLSRHEPATLAPQAFEPIHAVAAALAAHAERRDRASVQPAVPSGWRNVPTELQQASYSRADGETTTIGYAFRRHGLVVEVDGRASGLVQLWDASADHVELTVGGIRRRIDVHRVGSVVHVDGAGAASTLVELERLPAPDRDAVAGSMAAPLPGSVMRILVAAGDAVRAGQPLVVLEAMKMEHSVRSAHDGVVTDLLVRVGDQVDRGQSLIVVEESRDARDPREAREARDG